MDPDEVMRDKSFVHCDGPSDPPGESPNDRPIVCLDIVPVSSSGSSSVDSGGSGSGSSSRGSGRGYNRGRRSLHATNNVQWVDPKNVSHENEVDYSVLWNYEQLACAAANANEPHHQQTQCEHPTDSRALVVAIDAPPPSAVTSYHASGNHHQAASNTSLQQTSSLLLSNPRTRIATISSGYKKANFFVREDLDTRIYFHQLEDAIGYMARRGIVK